MNASTTTTTRQAARYVLRFSPLIDHGQTYAFPCDAAGHVAIDALSDRGRVDYLFARTLIGRDFSLPAVQPVTLH